MRAPFVMAICFYAFVIAFQIAIAGCTLYVINQVQETAFDDAHISRPMVNFLEWGTILSIALIGIGLVPAMRMAWKTHAAANRALAQTTPVWVQAQNPDPAPSPA